jgi:hypothetical protein
VIARLKHIGSSSSAPRLLVSSVDVSGADCWVRRPLEEWVRHAVSGDEGRAERRRRSRAADGCAGQRTQAAFIQANLHEAEVNAANNDLTRSMKALRAVAASGTLRADRQFSDGARLHGAIANQMVARCRGRGGDRNLFQFSNASPAHSSPAAGVTPAIHGVCTSNVMFNAPAGQAAARRHPCFCQICNILMRGCAGAPC